MINNNILREIRKNPLVGIRQRSLNSICVLFIYGKTRLEIAHHTNVIDCMNSRDETFREWYGQDMYNEIQKIYSETHGSLSGLIKKGPFYLSFSGIVYGRNFKEIKTSKSKNTENKYIINIKNGEIWKGRSKFSLSKEEFDEVLNGNALCVFNPNMDPMYLFVDEQKEELISSEDKPKNMNIVFSERVRRIGAGSPCVRSGISYLQTIISLGNIKVYFTGKKEEECTLFFMDMYYFLKGYLHPMDNRRIE